MEFSEAELTEALRQLDFPGLSSDGAAAWKEQRARALRR